MSEPSYLKQLIDESSDKAETERVLRQFSSNENDPLFWYLLSVKRAADPIAQEIRKLPNQIRRELKGELSNHLVEARELKRDIGGRGFWLKWLLSKLLTAVLMAVIIAAVVFYLHRNDEEMILTLSKNTNTLINNQTKIYNFQRDSYEAIRAADSQAATIYLIAQILHLPNTVLGTRNGTTGINVPKSALTIDSSHADYYTFDFKPDIESAIQNVGREDVTELLDRAYQNFTNAMDERVPEVVEPSPTPAAGN